MAKKPESRFLLYIVDENDMEKVKYSQIRQQGEGLFSYDQLRNVTEEVVTQMWIDEYKFIHYKARWKENKIYIQAKNIFEANVKFQKFINHQKSQNEKEKIETAD